MRYSGECDTIVSVEPRGADRQNNHKSNASERDGHMSDNETTEAVDNTATPETGDCAESYFTYQTPYGVYENCYFVVRRYPNGNRALQVMSRDEGPIAVLTVNCGEIVLDELICLKTWSENAGCENVLQDMGLIGEEPDYVIPSGYCEAKVYMLTEKGRKMLDGLEVAA